MIESDVSYIFDQRPSTDINKNILYVGTPEVPTGPSSSSITFKVSTGSTGPQVTSKY
jgi:hypothetical protein